MGFKQCFNGAAMALSSILQQNVSTLRLTSIYVHFATQRSMYTDQSVVKLFFEVVVKPHEFPKIVMSDSDPVFIISFWTTIFKLHKTKFIYRSFAYHPQPNPTDRKTKVENRFKKASRITLTPPLALHTLHSLLHVGVPVPKSISIFHSLGSIIVGEAHQSGGPTEEIECR